MPEWHDQFPVAPSTRLHLRFAAATLAVIATAGGALLWYVQRQEIAQSERTVSTHARYVVKSILRDELRPADLEAPVTGARRKKLDWLFDARVLVDGGLRVKLYRAPDGVVTYSNVPALIGTKTDDLDEFRTVLGGRTIRDVSTLNKEGGPGKDQKALEVYVPVALRGQTRPTAVFELYQSYAPVASAVRSFVMPFSFLLLAAVLAMWAALFPLIQRMVRALERDRSARRSAELALEETSEQLRQAQKMESIGRLAGGVAHDFNNLLLVINGYSEFLSSSLVDERQRHFAAEIRSAGERAAGLTQQLLAFSRRQVLQPRVVDLNESIRDLHGMLRSLIGEGIRVELSLDGDLRAIEADPGQVGQVLLNLAVNARDAMAGSGTLEISTFNAGDEVVLEVADTGTGMDEATRSRIFEPFFTTKDVGQGTGLGLSTVYGVVTQSGGTIDVRSAPGEGTTFSIRLPATDRVEAVEPDVDVAGTTAAERILVVDDEQIVRDLLAHTLRRQGYDVEVAAGARDARALEGPWDLLLTDVVMPEMDGVELARHVDARQVLFMSGYDQRALAESAGAFLQKPFSGDELARSIRALLDGSRALATA
jgi:two-component system, cell cycle sensor histidine kinase and response regulator CckA